MYKQYKISTRKEFKEKFQHLYNFNLKEKEKFKLSFAKTNSSFTENLKSWKNGNLGIYMLQLFKQKYEQLTKTVHNMVNTEIQNNHK